MCDQVWEKYCKSEAPNYKRSMMATQCPLKGGRAVFRARFFVAVVKDSINYDDDEACANKGYLRKKSTENIKDFDFLLTPNPAKDFVEIIMQNSTSNQTIIKVRDIAGKLVLTLLKKSLDNLIMNTSPFPSGIYQVEICAEEQISSKKLILIR